MTKRKIKERIKEHQNDIKQGKSNTALAQLYRKEIIKIDFENVRKIAHYNNHKYALLREALEISIDANACNHLEHAKIPPIWGSFVMKSHDRWMDIKEDEMVEPNSMTEDEEVLFERSLTT